jgi:DNA gyrase/topoisomerase IV subunit A
VGVVERRARHALGKATARLHLVEGFLKALGKLDAVVKVGGGVQGLGLGI